MFSSQYLEYDRTPAEDAQAVDRCYRIGQKKEVTVYRLIAAGTVEEKTYEKQIHKDGIRRAVLSNDDNVTRYFERDELRDLFKLGERGVCRVFDKFKHMVDIERYEFVYDLEGVIGITPHDGFYLKDGETNRGAFGGLSKEATPKILGKSQRVMARAAPQDVVSVEKQLRELSLSSETGSTGRRGVAKTKSAESEQHEDESFSTNDMLEQSGRTSKHQESLSQSNTQNVSAALLSSVSDHLSRGHEKKALEILIDIIESGTLEGDQKIEVHKRIALVSRSLGLI